MTVGVLEGWTFDSFDIQSFPVDVDVVKSWARPNPAARAQPKVDAVNSPVTFSENL